jgi:polysaccharide export outer membrane protein
MQKLLGLLLIVPVLAWAPGCSDKNKDHEIQVKQLQAFLQKPRAPINGNEYRIMPPDVISVKSVHMIEVTDLKQTVRPDGKLNLPLVGEIMVADHTAKQVEQDILEIAKKYYKNPDVTVTVVEYKSQNYYIFGEVVKQGPVAWTGSESLLDALSKAQPTLLCKPEEVTIVRGKTPQTGGFIPPTNQDTKKAKKANEAAGLSEQGAEKLVINVTELIQGGDLSHNILLRPNDVIYVPPDPMVAIGYAVNRMLYPIKPFLEAILPAATLAAGTGAGGGL